MAFDDGQSRPVYAPAPPDYSAGIAAYNEQVETISITIKDKQAELALVIQQIADAQTHLQLVYQNTRIEPLEDQIKTLQAQVVQFQAQHDEWLIKRDARQTEYNAISLDFSEKQKAIDDSWADFHVQSSALILAQKQLAADQDSVAAKKSDLAEDVASFNNSKVSQQAQIDQLNAQANENYAKAKQTLGDVIQKQAEANALSASVAQQLAELNAKIAAAQGALTQADAVAKQKAQNDIDAATNSANATQNQLDANQIKVAKIALANQQQEYNSRMVALQQAEAALPKG